MSFIKLINKIAKNIASFIGIIPNEKEEEMNKKARNYQKQWEDYYNASNKKQKMGLEKMSKGDFEGAIKEFDEGIKIYTLKNSIIWHRGHAKEMLGDYEGALKDYEYVANKPIFHIRTSEDYLKFPYDLYIGDKMYETLCCQENLSQSDIYPDNRNDWRWNLAVGRTKFEIGDYKGAIERLKLCFDKKDMFGFNIHTRYGMGKNDEHEYYFNEAKKALQEYRKGVRLIYQSHSVLNKYPNNRNSSLDLIEKSLIYSYNLNIENIAKGILRNSETREI